MINRSKTVDGIILKIWWLRAFLSFVSFGHSTRRLSCSRTKQQLKCLRYNDFSSSLLTFWFAFVSWQPTSFEFCAFAVTSRQLRNRFHISLLSQPIDRHCEDKSNLKCVCTQEKYLFVFQSSWHLPISQKNTQLHRYIWWRRKNSKAIERIKQKGKNHMNEQKKKKIFERTENDLLSSARCVKNYSFDWRRQCFIQLLIYIDESVVDRFNATVKLQIKTNRQIRGEKKKKKKKGN